MKREELPENTEEELFARKLGSVRIGSVYEDDLKNTGHCLAVSNKYGLVIVAGKNKLTVFKTKKLVDTCEELFKRDQQGEKVEPPLLSGEGVYEVEFPSDSSIQHIELHHSELYLFVLLKNSFCMVNLRNVIAKV